MIDTGESRRAFFKTVGAGVLLAACKREQRDLGLTASAPTLESAHAKAKEGEANEEVSAGEDLMHEHGILRRTLVVYREVASRLRKRADVSPDVLQKSARLFREFGQDFHEKKMEEAYVFPDIKRHGGSAVPLVDVLLAQHQRGREIIEWIISVTQAPKIGAKAEELANMRDAFARMFEAHTAWEDTVVFPAWKKTISPQLFDERGKRFVQIEYEQIGRPGYEEEALQKVSEIEASLGIGDLARLTAPAPPG